jgi:hypothetical protein
MVDLRPLRKDDPAKRIGAAQMNTTLTGELHKLAATLEFKTSKSQRKPNDAEWQAEINWLIQQIGKFTA